MSKTEEQLYKPTSTRLQMGRAWSPSSKDPANVIGVYARNPQKQHQYEIIDIGTFCLVHNIDMDMIKIIVDIGEQYATRFKGMTPEMIEEFEMFQEFRKMSKDKKSKK